MDILNKIKKFVLYSLLIFLVVFSGLLIWISFHYTVPIVMYHNVGVGQKFQNLWVSKETFHDHLSFLKEGKYNIISLDEFVEIRKRDGKFSRNTIVLTFDDGEVNNYENAFPMLKDFGFTATFFVPSGKIGTEGRLSWDQLREMSKEGMTIGSHTHREEYLPGLSVMEQKSEVLRSKKILEENLNVAVNHISYPVGGFTREVLAFVEEAGYMSASTTNRGFADEKNDLYSLRRVRVSNADDNWFYLWIKFSGYYNVFRKWKKPY